MSSLKKNVLLYNVALTVVFVLLALVFVYPFAKTSTIFFSDDMYYHLQRINELISDYQGKNFFVGIYTSTFNQIGYPLNLFYPWITLIPFVLISLLVRNQVMAIYLGIAFYTFLTLIFTYWTTLKFSKNRLQSFAASLIYAFCSYRVIDIFARFALGEFLALTFLPLCVYGLYAVIKGDYGDWPFLAFGMSFILLSHVLSTFIDLLFLIVIFIILIIRPVNNIKRRIMSLLKSMVVAITSSAIFLFPFLEQELYQQFAQPSKMDMVAQALLPSKLVAASLNNSLGRVDAGNTYNIGFVLLIILVVGIIKFSNFEKKYKIIFLLSLGLLIFTTTLAPWSNLQKTPLSLIQFPWRFLGPASYLLSIIGGYEVLLVKENKIVIISGLLIAVLFPWYAGINNMKNEISNPEQSMNYHMITYSNHGFSYAKGIKNKIVSLYYLDQYTPKKGLSKLGDAINRQGLVDNKKTMFTNTKATPNAIEFFSNKFKSSNDIVLPMYMYKNLEAVNGREKKIDLKANQYGQVKVVDTLGSSKIKIMYKLSKLDMLSIVLSIATWSIGIILLIRNLFRNWKEKYDETNSMG